MGYHAQRLRATPSIYLPYLTSLTLSAHGVIIGAAKTAPSIAARRHPIFMRCRVTMTFSLLLVAAALRLPAVPPAPAAVAPCPRRQLLLYVAHTSGSGDPEATLFARAAGKEAASGSWLQVGRVAAGLDTGDSVAELTEDDLSPSAAAASAAAAVTALFQAVQVQTRLCSEHACRLHPELRQAFRANASSIELGLQLGIGGIVAIASPAPGDASPAQLMSCGFAGDSPAPGAAGRQPKGMYADFWAAGGPAEYERDEVRARIRQMLAPSRLVCEGGAPAVVIFAWRRCGFATKARAALDARGVAYTSVELDKMGALHAELALMHKRTTVPYFFVRGEYVGGYEADALPGLVGVIDSLAGDTPGGAD